MLTIEQIREAMKDRNLARMAEGVGLARPTLSLIRNCKTMPSYDTLVRLSDYLEKRP